MEKLLQSKKNLEVKKVSQKLSSKPILIGSISALIEELTIVKYNTPAKLTLIEDWEKFTHLTFSIMHNKI
ncbi:hypothetical protein [Patiriisocius sp. Uisw_017]|uniref:hypothetical protein n=1 Tax=Patiriisocius sp. Uisw_017 TaxID=3230968 RepID=UPI0039EC424D